MLDLKIVHSDGPRLEPASGNGADSLIILLHGHGSKTANRATARAEGLVSVGAPKSGWTYIG